jgi:hypothetical protein
MIPGPFGRRAFAASVLFAAGILPATVEAQQQVDAPGVLSFRADSIPWLTVGVAGGTGWGESGSAALLSVQIPISRFVIIESETTRRAPGRWDFDTLTTGANLLFRAGTARVSGFVGGGFGVHRTTFPQTIPLPFPVVRYSPYPRTGLTQQVTGGIEVAVTRHVLGFGAVRAGTAPEDGVRFFGGVRMAIGARVLQGPPLSPGDLASSAERARSAAGREVRVTTVDGVKRTGRLVTLSDAGVVIRTTANDVGISLPDIRKVERVSHGVRTGALIGSIPAGALWVLLSIKGCGDCYEARAGISIMSAVAVGAGAGIGALVNAARADRNLIYEAPGPKSSIRVTPMLLPRRQAIQLSIHW